MRAFGARDPGSNPGGANYLRMINYQKLFKRVKKDFLDVKAVFISFDRDSVMRSDVFSKNIYYNSKLIRKMGFSKKAIIGIIAHELAHKVDFKYNRNIFDVLFHKLRYKPYSSYKRKVERAADTITVERGYGPELLQAMIETKKNFGKERYKKYEDAHLTMNEVKDLIKSSKEN